MWWMYLGTDGWDFFFFTFMWCLYLGTDRWEFLPPYVFNFFYFSCTKGTDVWKFLPWGGHRFAGSQQQTYASNGGKIFLFLNFKRQCLPRALTFEGFCLGGHTFAGNLVVFNFNFSCTRALTFESFCLGGHKFAGNLVVYPQGDWYGNLDSRYANSSRSLLYVLGLLCMY
jgi:hypothetical protein